MTTLVQVRGTIRAPDNTPAPDLVVTFRLSGPLLDAASNLLVEPVTVRADVSALGVFAVSLAANDDPALQPAGSTYLVSVSARGTSESRHIIVPIAGAALGVELADIATAVPGPLVFSYALSSTVTALDARVVVLEAGGGGAAGAVETHRADTTVVHGIADTAALVLTSDARLTGNQPLDADLTAIAAVDSAVAGVLASEGAGWLRRSYAQVKTSLGLTKADVGLGNVDNTADASKPVSAAQAAADAAIQAASQPLDSDLTAIAALATTAYGRSFLDRTNAAAGRTVLALGGSATLGVGTTSGTVAAGDDTRIVGAVGPWAANTAYAAGKPVVNPSGSLVSALIAFTSGATYSAANWSSPAVPVDELWIPAANFVVGSGAPTLNGSQMGSGWSLPDSSTTLVVAVVGLPLNWATYKVDFWFIPLASGGGNIDAQLLVGGNLFSNGLVPLGAGADYGPSLSDSTLLIGPLAMPTVLNEIRVTTFPTSGGKTVPSGPLTRLQVRRNGAAAPDTYVGAAGFIGAMFRKVT